MAGRKKLDAFKTSPGPWHGGESEDVIDTPAVRLCRNNTRRKQPFDFRCKKKPVVLPSPKKRRNAKAIPPQLKLMPCLVPQCDCKLSAEPFPHSLPMVFPQMRNDFGIAMCDESVSLLSQFRAAFDVIKEFAIKDNK